MTHIFPAFLHEDEEGDGYTVFFHDFQGCVTMGDTVDEALENGAEALGLFLACMKMDGDPIPVPSSKEDILLDVWNDAELRDGYHSIRMIVADRVVL